MTYYTCVVCGYDKLEYPQYLNGGEPTFIICGCCGFESGFDDLSEGYSIEDYRKKWILNGSKWFDSSAMPQNWNSNNQLKNISKEVTKVFK